jgi:hypothetical protein
MSGMLTAGANRLLSDDYERASFLPVVRNKQTGKRSLGVPQVAKDVLSALMLPGDVYQGNVPAYGADGRTSPQMIEGAANLGGMITVGAGAIPAEANSLRMGIKAYHGSPHDFDRFDMSKIGTGEGAQAYGHGLYFAENADVARGYRTAMEKGYPHPKISGEWLSEVHDRLMKQGETEKANMLALLHDKGDVLAVRQSGDKFNKETLSWFEENIAPHVSRDGGRMYEVNIDANPDDFLDWDKPLSEQTKVAEKLGYNTKPRDFEAEARAMPGTPEWVALEKQMDSRVGSPGVPDVTGAEYYRGDVLRGSAGQEADLSAYLRGKGIPGIKYLDAGSRGAGDGSRNYVVFDDKLISIVKKYGVAALVSAGVLSQAQGEEMKAQGFN